MMSRQSNGSSSFEHLKASSSRIIYAVMGAFIILIAYFIIREYYQTIHRSSQQTLRRLHAISFTAATLIEGDEHEALALRYTTKDAIKGNTQDSLYLKLHNTLAYVQKINNLGTPVYTFVFNPADSSFNFIVTSAEEPYYYHTYQMYPRQLIEQYDTGGELNVYEDENGVWLSSFAPIKNSNGTTVALIQADLDFSDFLANARIDLMWNALISIAILLPFGAILVMYVSRLLRKQTEAQMLLHEQNEEIKTQHEIIEKHNRELDERVKKRTAELEVLNRELSDFLYHSSHDVQAPIATLKGLFALAEKELKDPDSRDYIQRMHITTERLEKITQTIKLVHEIKVSDTKPAPVPLKELISRTIQQLDPPAENFSYTINVPDAFKITNDRKLLQIIFYEVIKNAHQYRNQKGPEKPCVTISLKNETEDNICVEIDDNGEGIDPYIKENIFTMFKRGNEKSLGMGMGLSIVKTCLEKSQGSIQLADKEGPGTKFLLQIKKYKTDR